MFKWASYKKRTADLQKTNVTLNGKLAIFETMVTCLQTENDILYCKTGQTQSKYKTKSEQTTELKKKYKGIAEFGNQIAQRLVNLRVAFSMPNGISLIENSLKVGVVNKTIIEDAKAFLNEFLVINGLDNALPRDLAKESEFQGQVLIRLVWDETIKNVRLMYIPVDEISYKVKNVNQYIINSPKVATFTDENNSIGVKTLSDKEFVFIAFNDDLNVFEGMPTCGGILGVLDNLDKDLTDWRSLNHLYAHPTPHFKCETQDDADAINALIKTLGWKVGTALATNSDFQLKGTTGVEANLLMLSITTNAKIISAHTGIAIHFLGFANVTSSRATVDDMGEPTEVGLHSEITSWTKFYKEMFYKVMAIRNENLNQELPVDIVLPKIIPLTDKQYELLKDVYLPLLDKGCMSTQTIIEQIPSINTDVEKKRIAEDAAVADAKRMKEAELLSKKMEAKGKEEGGGNKAANE